MLQRLFVALAAGFAVAASAADVNTASQADLESLAGIGPATAATILDERSRGDFKDWPDFVHRVKGMGAARAARLSAQGLTVNGVPASGAVSSKGRAASAASK